MQAEGTEEITMFENSFRILKYRFFFLSLEENGNVFRRTHWTPCYFYPTHVRFWVTGTFSTSLLYSGDYLHK